MPDFPASQRDLDALARKVDFIDQNGSRGMGVLAIQVAEIIKDLGILDTRVENRFAEHAAQHQREAEVRSGNRKWVMTTAIGGVASMGGLYALIINIAAHLH